MKTITLILLSVLLSLGGATRVQAQRLTLEVHGIERTEGTLFVGVYSSDSTFLRKLYAGFRVEVKTNPLILPLTGLTAGTYAIGIFHDQNDNGTLDTATFGIPLEPTGFSNDARGMMRPPEFKDARFTFSQDTTLVVRLR